MYGFFAGMITMGFVAAGLFFLKFWSRSRDPLFAIFAAAFWLLALNQAILGVIDLPHEERSWAFFLRLAAFSLLAIAIVYKNAAARRSSASRSDTR